MNNRFAKYKKLMLISALVSMLSLLFAGCGDDEYVQTVKTGYMKLNDSATVGDAFDQFFSDGKWESFKSDNGQHIVEFNGKCRWNNKPADFRVQFKFTDKNSFELGYLGINGNAMTVLDSLDIMDKIISSAK